MPILKKSREKQSSYWQDRQERLILAGEKTATEMLTDLKTAYEATELRINKEIEAFYGRYAKETGLTVADIQQRLSPAALKTAKEDIAKYYAEVERLGLDPHYGTYLRGLSARAYMSRLEELKLNVRHEVEKLYAEQQSAFNSGLNATFEDSYYLSTFNIQQATGLAGSFTALNTATIEKAVRQRWLGDNYSSLIWEDKDRLVKILELAIPQGMAAGQNPRIIGRTIHDRMFGQGQAKGRGGMLGRAINLARTEFNFIANDATWDSYKESGVVSRYEYLATLDEQTTDSCAELDGQNFALSEKMLGINYPPMATPPHPCRSTTVPYFPPDEIDALFAKPERIARGPDGVNYYVPADLSYRKWREGLEKEGDKVRYRGNPGK